VVVRVAPLAESSDGCGGCLANERRERISAASLPEVVERFERLVREVEGWPPSMNTWSVTAANIIVSTSAS
jgi:hypothetical protein